MPWPQRCPGLSDALASAMPWPQRCPGLSDALASAMPWPWSALNCGPRRLSPPRRLTETGRNSQPTGSAACCSSPADRPDVQTQAKPLPRSDAASRSLSSARCRGARAACSSGDKIGTIKWHSKSSRVCRSRVRLPSWVEPGPPTRPPVLRASRAAPFPAAAGTPGPVLPNPPHRAARRAPPRSPARAWRWPPSGYCTRRDGAA